MSRSFKTHHRFFVVKLIFYFFDDWLVLGVFLMCLVVVLMGFHRCVKKYKDGGGHWRGHQILTNKLK